MIRALAISCSLLFACPALATEGWAEFSLPSGQAPLSERTSALDSYHLPIGPFADGQVPARTIEGRVSRRTWRLKAGDRTTLQILTPLRAKVEKAGYKIVFECQNRDCGGFDFRFGIEIVPAPDMAVDIGDYRFVSAMRGDQALTLLISRSGQTGYVQAIQVTPEGQHSNPPDPEIDQTGNSDNTTKGDSRPLSLAKKLQESGHAVLQDLEFATGSATLGVGPFQSLQQLSGFLVSNPQFRVALVGHTDDVGQLSANIALSRQRAEAVRQRLLDLHGIDGARVEAEGVGYLAPLVSNQSEEGRETNRRVEVVLIGR
jgi:OmpA-OmpF porin, OOP family